MKICLSCNSIAGYFPIKFFTWYDMPGAKFCSDYFTTTWMRVKWDFHWIKITMEKTLVKCALDDATLLNESNGQNFLRNRGNHHICKHEEMKFTDTSCDSVIVAVMFLTMIVLHQILIITNRWMAWLSRYYMPQERKQFSITLRGQRNITIADNWFDNHYPWPCAWII